jgi:hypothetical protein
VTNEEPAATLALWDYRRRVADSYAEVRHDGPSEDSWRRWRHRRDTLFASHPQTPLEPKDIGEFPGLPFFAYDPAWHIEVAVIPVETELRVAGHSAAGTTPLLRFGEAHIEVAGKTIALSLYWMDTYGGGVFLPFRDATSGLHTYGGGRYLLDTAKGADLGHTGNLVVLDFNFAYHPSCVHSPRWSCPLPPAENTIALRVEAGERL